MRRPLLAILALALPLALAGCALPAGIGSGVPGADTGASIGPKVVAAKEAPATLIAVDRSECYVSAVRFERAKPGDRVWCAWRARGRIGSGASDARRLSADRP